MPIDWGVQGLGPQVAAWTGARLARPVLEGLLSHPALDESLRTEIHWRLGAMDEEEGRVRRAWERACNVALAAACGEEADCAASAEVPDTARPWLAQARRHYESVHASASAQAEEALYREAALSWELGELPWVSILAERMATESPDSPWRAEIQELVEAAAKLGE